MITIPYDHWHMRDYVSFDCPRCGLETALDDKVIATDGRVHGGIAKCRTPKCPFREWLMLEGWPHDLQKRATQILPDRIGGYAMAATTDEESDDGV
ncbi:MAG: hypothetical protein KGI03_00870 [Patescibacteria group bacterium]|nr:hypothetical protein [Patescibacteria group bacterium]